MSRQEVRVPDLGDFDKVEIVEVQVKPGDTVAPEAPLITLETDKAAMEVPAPMAGRVIEVKVKRGDKVSKGDLILILEVAAAPAALEPTVDMPRPAAPPAAAAGAPPKLVIMQVTVPDIGDFKDVEIVEVQVKVGDTVGAEAPLITLETDKAAMEVPAPAPGRVIALRVKTGDRVSKGDVILELETTTVPDVAAGPAAGGAATATSRAPAIKGDSPASPVAPQRPAATLPPIDERTFGKAHASPAVRKFGRELGVNLAQVKGMGPKGRVLKEDIQAWVKAVLTGQVTAPGAALPKVPVVDFAKYGEIELRPLSRVRKISGPRLLASWLNIPHVTQHDEADITDVEERRQKLKRRAEREGVKLTSLAFVIRACLLALKEFPDFNSSLTEDGTGLVHKKYHHIGFAADTPQGLVVPVIRDADQKDLLGLARELGTLSAKAREGKLTAEEMRGGTFTVSSLGGIGGTFFTPIINAPEVAILGVGRAAFRQVWREKSFVPRLILPLSLSYDHRVIDGATGARFTSFLVQALAEVERLVA